MKFPEMSLRKDPQILDALLHAKGRLATGNDDAKRYMICLALPDTGPADEIRTAISAALGDCATLWQWYSHRALEMPDVEIQARRHAWLDQMILDQIKLPCVKLRRRPEIKAILLEAKSHLRTTYAGMGRLFVCHAVSQACIILDLNDYLEEVQAAICQPLGDEENTASAFFKSQCAYLSDDQCQALRHRWLDQMIGEQL